MPCRFSSFYVPAVGCAWFAATAGVSHAQLAISLDDNGVQVQNGSSPPLVVGPGQSFGGTLTPQGFQGVMSGPKGTKLVTPPAANPFREAPAATSPQRLQIQAGGVSVSLPTASSPMSKPVPMAKLMALREMLRKADYPAAQREMKSMMKDYAPDAEMLQMKALLMLHLKHDREAAECVYDALAMGPAWDWAMLRSAMPSKDAAMELYRRLQMTSREQPSLHADFLLAWWEHMLGHRPESLRALRSALAARPNDPLMMRLSQQWSAMDEDDAPPAALR